MLLKQTDVIINGGGLAGLALALGCASLGLKSVIIEPLTAEAQTSGDFDGRTVALAYTAVEMFRKLGVWQHLESSAGAIKDIRIVDGNSPLWLHYDHREVGDNPMGYIVENRHLRMGLVREVAKHPLIDFRTSEIFDSYKLDNPGIAVKLKSGEWIQGKVLVGADGRYSAVRNEAGIDVRVTDYKQTALVCTVRHEQPHHGVAIERFLPAGPFAILPMGKVEGQRDGHCSSLVWTERPELVPHYTSMPEGLFIERLNRRFCLYLGAIELVGKVWNYPLSLSQSTQLTAERVALVSDAAQGIHPIAGQGYNLGMRDIAALLDEFDYALRHGLDIGDREVLRRYESARKADTAMMIMATDALNKLFSNNVMPVRVARNLGLAAVERMPALKKQFMRHAMGIRKHQATLMQPSDSGFTK